MGPRLLKAVIRFGPFPSDQYQPEQLQEAVSADLASQGQAPMTIPHDYIGCDISKAHLDFYDPATERHWRVSNRSEPIKRFLSEQNWTGSQIILEATGCYDRTLRSVLEARGIASTRVNPTRARRFGQAIGYLAKTDRIDAAMLAELGRRLQPPADAPTDKNREALSELQVRRDQLVTMRATEKTRRQASPADLVASHDQIIAALDTQIKEMDVRAKVLIAQVPELAEDMQRLQTMTGIGPVAATVITAGLAELGQRSAGQIAALVGLAPFNRESGTWQGKRNIRGGRRRVRRALYMAALSASRHCPHFSQVYQRILARSGVKKVALIAVARKMLVALNAMQRDKTNYA